jgi:polysaccharide pyruvyl transferase WcaK-like protein
MNKASIVFLNFTGSKNLGVSNVQITVYCAADLHRLLDLGIDVVYHPWYRRRRREFLMLLESLARTSYALFYRIFSDLISISQGEPKIVIDSVSDRLNETWGIRESFYSLAITFLARIFFKKAVIIIGPTSLGPIRSSLTKYMARFVLNRVNIIILRENGSKNHLINLGINKPTICVLPDVAFLLDFSTDKFRETKKPLIGIAVRWTTIHHMKLGILIAEIVDYLTKKWNAEVHFIPQVEPLDNKMISKIYPLIKNKNDVTILSTPMSAEKFKGSLAIYDLIISFRLHGSIFSTSMGVPTITISYAKKVNEIIGKMIGEHDSIFDVEELINHDQVLSALKSRIDYLLVNRHEIMRKLLKRTQLIKEKALFLGVMIKEIIQDP